MNPSPVTCQSQLSFLRPWVRLFVYLLQPLHARVRVDLRRADRRVAEQLLHRPQVRTGVEQVRGKGVPQGVAVHSATTEGMSASLGDGALQVRPAADAAERAIAAARGMATAIRRCSSIVRTSYSASPGATSATAFCTSSIAATRGARLRWLFQCTVSDS